jgi:BMFP domain-containing protein YqiC
MAEGPNRVFDEFAKLMTDAAGVAQGMRKEAETVFRSQAERMLNGLDLVKRDDFDAVKEMAARAREENDLLTARLSQIEARLDSLEKGKKSASSASVKPKAAKPAKKA